jgi:hypothetical protein
MYLAIINDLCSFVKYILLKASVLLHKHNLIDF